MKKILYVQHADAIGGSVVSLRNLAEDATAAGFDCTIMCKSSDTASFYQGIGVNCVVSKIAAFNHNSSFFYKFTLLDFARLVRLSIKSVLAAIAYIRLVRKLRPSLVHLNSSVLPLYAVLTKCLGIPVIWHIRENIAEGYFGLRKRLLLSTANIFADFVVFISEAEWRAFPVDASKSIIAYNYMKHRGTETTHVPASSQGSNIFNIISLGGVAEIKGTKTIVGAAKYLPDNFRVKIVGAVDPLSKTHRTPYEQVVCSLLVDDQIRGKVTFVPPSLDVETLIYGSDVLVFWGLVPHFPRPVYEAWMLGKPVIAYKEVAVNADVTKDTAVLVDEDDAKALSSAILEVRDNYDNYIVAAKRGKMFAEKKFGPENFRKIHNLYVKVLHG